MPSRIHAPPTSETPVFAAHRNGRHFRGTSQTQVEYLFARFAWTMPHLVKVFVLMGRQQKKLARYRAWDDGEAQGTSMRVYYVLYMRAYEVWSGAGPRIGLTPTTTSRQDEQRGRTRSRDDDDARSGNGDGARHEPAARGPADLVRTRAAAVAKWTSY